ncbi:unnamed protein product, partial [Symbiodinium microadriaticum]
MVSESVRDGDTGDELKTLAAKVAKVQLWPDVSLVGSDGDSNADPPRPSNIVDCGYEVLVVLQQSLHATFPGPQPSQREAMDETEAQLLFQEFLKQLRVRYQEEMVVAAPFGEGVRVETSSDGTGLFDLSVLNEPRGPARAGKAAGRPPAPGKTAQAGGISVETVSKALRKLGQVHRSKLEKTSSQIYMAMGTKKFRDTLAEATQDVATDFAEALDSASHYFSERQQEQITAWTGLAVSSAAEEPFRLQRRVAGIGAMPCRMQWVRALALVLVVTANGAATPVQKVLTALESMKTTKSKEMQDEKLQFAKFEQFCTSELGYKRADLKELSSKIELTRADIDSLDAEASRLSEEIAGHEAHTAKLEKSKANATEVREAEAADYDALKTDLGESVTAIDAALKTLQEQDYDREQVLVQVHRAAELAHLSEEDLDSLSKVFSMEKPTAPKADAYEFQSGNVIEMLKMLQAKFVNQTAEADMAETKKKNSYNLLLTSLNNGIDVSKKATEKKGTFKSSTLSQKAEKEATKAKLDEDYTADQKLASDLDTECKVKASDFAERQRLRSDEVTAITQALKIILSRTSPYLHAGTSLAALRTEGRRQDPVLDRTLRFLQAQATALDSTTLRVLVERLRQKDVPDGAAGPVKRIAAMLKELMSKIKNSDVDDASQQVWCDKELKTNGEARETKTSEIEELKAEIDRLQALLAELGEENSKLASDISALDKSIKDTTVMREEEKAANLKNLHETTEGKEAVAEATQILRDFYSNLGPSFVQLRSNESHHQDSRKPEFAAGDYGDSGQSKVLELMQEMTADLAQEANEIQATENTAEKEFQTFLADSQEDRSKKQTTQQKNEMTISSQSNVLSQRKVDLLATEKQLAAANDYYEELHGKCLDKSTNFAA